MSRQWGDLVARSRGLSSHLVTRAGMRALAEAADLEALADGLRQAGITPEDAAATPERLELAVRRAAAGALATLRRWSGPRSGWLAVVFEQEELRSLRAILRGFAQSAAPERRLAGLVPTPALPERALLELARQPTALDAAKLLIAWRHPFGTALLPVARSPHPDLLRLETALVRAFVDHALLAARSSRSSVLLDYAREFVDIENALTALALVGPDAGTLVPKELYLRAGHMPIDAFERAISASGREEAAALLAASLPKTPVAAALRAHGADREDLERTLLASQIIGLTRLARREPLGAAVVLLFALKLREQVVDLRRIIWGLALGAPPERRAPVRGAA